jgi:hypothetical protein
MSNSTAATSSSTTTTTGDVNIRHSFDIPQNLTVSASAPEKGVVVAESQWARLMNRIENCGDNSAWFEAAGWASIGVATSALTTATTFPFSANWTIQQNPTTTIANMPAVITEVAYIAATVAFAAIGMLSIWFARKYSQNRDEMRKIVVEDMEALSASQGICRSITSR